MPPARAGTASAAAAAALILVRVCWPLLPRRWSRVLLGGFAGAWAVVVGLSRVALIVHRPTDVVGAWLFVLVVVRASGLLVDRLVGREVTATDGSPSALRENPD